MSLWWTQHRCPKQNLKKQQRYQACFLSALTSGWPSSKEQIEIPKRSWLTTHGWFLETGVHFPLFSIAGVLRCLEASCAWLELLQKTGLEQLHLSKWTWIWRSVRAQGCALEEPCLRHIKKETWPSKNPSCCFRMRKCEKPQCHLIWVLEGPDHSQQHTYKIIWSFVTSFGEFRLEHCFFHNSTWNYFSCDSSFQIRVRFKKCTLQALH